VVGYTRGVRVCVSHVKPYYTEWEGVRGPCWQCDARVACFAEENGDKVGEESSFVDLNGR
jgi:hypothetical protein